MAEYSIARRSTDTTNGEVAMDVVQSTGPRGRIMELAITLAAATASTYGINRPSAVGTRTSPVALLQEDPQEPTPTGICLVDSAIAHSVQPTLATNYFRRVALPATIGTGRAWAFPKGLVLDFSKGFAVVNLATNGAIDCELVVSV